MWVTIVTTVLKFIFSMIGKDYAEYQKSREETLKGRAESVETSYAEENNAKEAAEEAKKKAEIPGSDDDVFGSSEGTKGR